MAGVWKTTHSGGGATLPEAVTLASGFGSATNSIFARNEKLFELSNHLGNVLVTVSDKKVGVDGDANGVIDHNTAEVVTANDYYSGGMDMPGKTYTNGNTYRYSINEQEKTPEIAPNTTTALFWEYDARIVRRWNVDPVVKEYESPYMCFAGNPVLLSDHAGDCATGTCPHCGRNHNPSGGGSLIGEIGNWLYGIKVDLTCERRWNEAVTNVNRLVPVYNATAAVVGEENLGIPSYMQPMSRGEATFNAVTGWMVWKYAKIAAGSNGPAQLEMQLGSVPVNPRSFTQQTAVQEVVNEEKTAAITNFRVTSGMSRTAKADVRRAFAQHFFETSGKSPNSVRMLMQTIDFSRKVKETVLNVGDKIFRFERTKGVIEKEKHFYTNAYGADGGATAVGFADASGYKLVTYEVTERTVVMESTIRGTKTTQYYSVELQNRIRKIGEE